MTPVPNATATATVHIVGAGVAGLACAVRLARQGRRVVVYEAAPAAGGRCRSFHDATLDRHIDNGNHLLLSANRAVLAFLGETGASDRLVGPPSAAFPFVDLADGARWTLRPDRGPLPWWVLRARTRIPGTRLADYLSGLAIAGAGPGHTVADRVPAGHPLYRRFWEPLTLAALNAVPEVAAARPLWAVMRETFARGAAWCRPLVARDGLSDTFVDPALAQLAAHGAGLRFGSRLSALEMEEGGGGSRIARLIFASGPPVELTGDDGVVLAVPAPAAAALCPGLSVPAGDGHPIVNAHFRLPAAATLPEGSPFLGIVGGEAHWLFVRDDIASVTVSDARALADRPAGEVAARLWRDVAAALGLAADTPQPLARIVKERRATFIQSPDNLRRRPKATTPWRNLLLAGDWTDTGIPATIEGAVRSGHTAAELILHQAH
jgi:squalene-associated FAD-dependent desaturase